MIGLFSLLFGIFWPNKKAPQVISMEKAALGYSTCDVYGASYSTRLENKKDCI
jgi:hypothetical protein